MQVGSNDSSSFKTIGNNEPVGGIPTEPDDDLPELELDDDVPSVDDDASTGTLEPKLDGGRRVSIKLRGAHILSSGSK